jgi:hypothetical protein
MVQNTTLNGALFYPNFNVDGVFGMGREQVSNKSLSFLARAAYNGHLKSTTWSYQPAPGNNTANLFLGGYDASQVNGSLTWMSVPNDTMEWNSTMQNMTINGTELWNNTVNEYTTLMFVTGYKYMGLPASVWYHICSVLQAANPGLGVSCLASASRISATGPCENFAPFNLSLQFNTTATYIIPSDGTTYYSATSNKCYWNFNKVGNGTEFIIGEQFFQQFYTVFDNENSRMGFGVGAHASTAV